MKTDLEVILMLIVVIIGVLIAISLSAVMVPHENEIDIIEEQESIQKEEMEMIAMYDNGFINLYKVHDNKDNVTCWIYRGGQGGGISCIPDHMLSP